MLLIVLRRLEDGVEIIAQPGSGSVRLSRVKRPCDDEILDFRCELADEGMHAATWVRTIDGDGIVSWMAELAESFRGWEGVRTWLSLEKDLRIDATHDRWGHVGLRFVIRGHPAYRPGSWEASASVTLDAGEDMRGLAAVLGGVFGA